MAPTKSLCSQKAAEWKKKLQSVSCSVVELTVGDEGVRDTEREEALSDKILFAFLLFFACMLLFAFLLLLTSRETRMPPVSPPPRLRVSLSQLRCVRRGRVFRRCLSPDLLVVGHDTTCRRNGTREWTLRCEPTLFYAAS